MQFAQIHDVLHSTQVFHQELSARYQAVAKESALPRIKMLLDYLASHEAAQAEALARYEADAPDAVAQTWYQSPPELDLPLTPAALQETLPSLDLPQLVDLAVRYHENLVRYYNELKDRAPSVATAELFAHLASTEAKEAMRVVRDAEELQDL